MKPPPKLSIRPAVLLALVLLLSGCATRGPMYGLMTADELHSHAVEAFENRRWDRAIQILDVFLASHLGDPRAPDARMMLGDVHMERREYATAATHYQRLVTDFPTHPRTREARFLMCESYYRLSPSPVLDQQYTVSALLHCESVAQSFPGTEEGEQAQSHVTDLRNRLAQKTYETGLFYFRRGAYDSAVVYFEEVVRTYPFAPIAPTALGQLVETFNRIGYVEDAAEARERLLREYPQSPEAQALRA